MGRQEVVRVVWKTKVGPPVAKGGQSVLGNLVVLCPNHHKEFDLLEIVEQSAAKLIGTLYGSGFKIAFPTP